MKKIYLFLLILLVLTDISYSQRRAVRRVILVRRTYWTFSIDGGITAPMGDLGNSYKTSGNAGIELTYHPGPNFGFFFSTQYNFMIPIDPTISGTSGYLELGLGGRVYFGKGPARLFIEGGFGD